MAARARSAFAISLTPFTAAGELDRDALRAHLRRLCAAGIGVYVAGGGSGEGYTLSAAERAQVLAIAGEELRGRVPVRGMGTEPRAASEMLTFARDVEAAGLDALQVYSLDMGHRVIPTAAELERYFDEVLSHAGLPCVLATHFYGGYLVPVDVLERLAGRHPHVIGINATVGDGDIAYLVRVIDTFAGGLEVHVGGPTHALTALGLGASGYLSSEANLAPRLCVSVTDRWEADDVGGAVAAHAAVMRLYAANRYGSIRGIKGALGLLGLPGGHPRAPRLPVGDAELAEIAAMLDALGLDELPRRRA